MKKSLLSFDVQPMAGTQANLDLVREWPERLAHVLPMIPYLTATFVHQYIRSKLPRGTEYRAYRQGLEVAKVRGMPEGEYAYALQVNLKSSLVRKIKPHNVLLYVHAKLRATRKDPAVEILEKYNPWTVDSLPFTPDPKLGFVKTKKARAPLVQATTAKRLRERVQWSRELVHVGKREIRKDRRLKIPKKVHQLPTIALEVMKMEFGLGGTRPRPLWRLGIRKGLRTGLRSVLRDPKYLVFPLTRPSYKLWKKWPVRTKHSIPNVKVTQFMAFQRKLGLHVKA